MLLDREMDHPVVAEIREAVETGSDAGETRITDLHVWRVGKGAYSCALILVTHDPDLTAERVREQLAVHEEIVHMHDRDSALLYLTRDPTKPLNRHARESGHPGSLDYSLRSPFGRSTRCALLSGSTLRFARNDGCLKVSKLCSPDVGRQAGIRDKQFPGLRFAPSGLRVVMRLCKHRQLRWMRL